MNRRLQEKVRVQVALMEMAVRLEYRTLGWQRELELWEVLFTTPYRGPLSF